MTKDTSIKLFENRKVRSVWDAEPFKLWLSQLARERLEEIDDPEAGGEVACNTRKEIEAKTGKKIISSMNAKALKANQNKKELSI